MLTKQVCRYNDKKKDVEWIDLPVEKEDIISYIEKRVNYIESDFVHCNGSNFFDEITFLRHIVVAFGDLDILTYQEVREYLLKHGELCERYAELRKK